MYSELYRVATVDGKYILLIKIWLSKYSLIKVQWYKIRFICTNIPVTEIKTTLVITSKTKNFTFTGPIHMLWKLWSFQPIKLQFDVILSTVYSEHNRTLFTAELYDYLSELNCKI